MKPVTFSHLPLTEPYPVSINRYRKTVNARQMENGQWTTARSYER